MGKGGLPLYESLHWVFKSKQAAADGGCQEDPGAATLQLVQSPKDLLLGRQAERDKELLPLPLLGLSRAIEQKIGERSSQ